MANKDTISSLSVSEKFYSIQGEGQTMGIPSVFIRLSGCNLLCKSKDWVCDSIDVWRKGVKTYFNEVLNNQDVNKLREGAHLVLTGGEPLLHQKKISEYILWFQDEYGFLPIIEVETNGTIKPSKDMMILVDYWNCSPKLSNSGETRKRRINEDAIMSIADMDQVIFKFVISDRKDLMEILDDYGNLINSQDVVLMPAGETQEKLNEKRQMVVEMCMEFGYRYSERLHIVIWNQKTGV